MEWLLETGAVPDVLVHFGSVPAMVLHESLGSDNEVFKLILGSSADLGIRLCRNGQHCQRACGTKGALFCAFARGKPSIGGMLSYRILTETFPAEMAFPAALV